MDLLGGAPARAGVRAAAERRAGRAFPPPLEGTPCLLSPFLRAPPKRILKFTDVQIPENESELFGKGSFCEAKSYETTVPETTILLGLSFHNLTRSERVTGLGPVARPWQGRILPLYDTRPNFYEGIMEQLSFATDDNETRWRLARNQSEQNLGGRHPLPFARAN